MSTHERRDELAFSVEWFDCRTCKRGVAHVHTADCSTQIKCGSVQKIVVRSYNMSCDFLQDLQFGQPIQFEFTVII